MDLLADFAEHLPVIVIAELLGVPEADRAPLRPWSNAIVKMYEYDRPAEVQEAAVRACVEFSDYLRDLLAERRAAPREDLISDLIAVEEEGERISEAELIATAVLLLNAGHEATVNVIGNGFGALLERPDELRRLLDDPTLLDSAVEELIRFDSPLQLFERTAGADVEIGGVTVAEGQKVAALLGAANRDPEVFTDPGRLDVGRSPNPQVGFGAGIHFCIGAPLARVELQVGVRALLDRLEGIELIEEPRMRPGFVIRGRESVRVSFTPS